MSEGVVSRTMRADNYALSEETKAVRDQEQARLTDHAYSEAVRLLQKHRASLDRVAHALLEKETLDRAELEELLEDVAPESHHAETVGTPRALPATELQREAARGVPPPFEGEDRGFAPSSPSSSPNSR
jgi:cell division protease FtsH